MYASVGKVARLGVAAAWNQAILVMTPHPGQCDEPFLIYWLEAVQPSLEALARSNTQDNLNAEQVANLPFPTCSIATQKAISRFLHREIAGIDKLIERKRALIGLLHEALTARTTDRIDEVARSSSTLSLRRVAAVSFSNVDKKTNEGDQSVRLCNYTDVYDQDEIGDDPGFMEATATADQIKRLELRAGDVLVTKDSETPDDIGVPAWVPEDLPGVVCGYYLAIIRPDQSRLRGDYLFWALRSPMCREQFSVAANGITRFGLRADAVQGIQVPVPPLGEQAAIAADLKRAASSAHRAADALTRQVKLLRDHRQALITAAVTGQVEVSGEAS